MIVKPSLRDIPPCPDPGKYILVHTKESSYWRRKRGTVKKATLNNGFTENIKRSKIAGPAARRIKSRLEGFLRGLKPGRLILALSNALKKAIKEKGEMDFSFLQGLELQKEYPLHKLLQTHYEVEQGNGELQIRIAGGREMIKRHNRLVSDYFFEAVLLFGNPVAENGLRTESVVSKLYVAGQTPKKDCVLTIELPAKRCCWMLLLKVSCMEGNEMAHHQKHYGMKVVKVGKGQLRG